MAARALGLGLSLAGAGVLADTAPPNLALSAKASAFESYEDLTPAQAVDGNTSTRWSGIPGHEQGGWFELNWSNAAPVSEVVVLQYDRYTSQMDAQVWDDGAQNWVTVGHRAEESGKLPKVVEYRFEPRSVKRLRLANIIGGPSFTEIEVFGAPYEPGPQIHLASDVNGRFIGMVSDGWNTEPLAGVEATLAGDAALGPWKEDSRTDEHGIFMAAMPLGLAGKVRAWAKAPGEGAEDVAAEVAAEDFQYGLTPPDLKRPRVTLDEGWKFATDPPSGFWRADFDDRSWKEIHVPAHFAMEGFASADGVGGYRKHFRAPEGKGRLKLRFDGVYSGAEVWVNGHRVAYHEAGALPFEADITGAVHSGENLLAVRVTEHTAVSDRLDHMSQYADFPLAGIMRPVYLFRAPEAHIGALQVSTQFDADFRDATLHATVAAMNESPEGHAQAAVELRLLDGDGDVVLADAAPVAAALAPWSRAEASCSLPVREPKHWEAEHPNLYVLEVTLKSGRRVLDRVSQRVGFRQTDIRGGELLINGQPVKIRGTCHHDSDPLLGRAVTPELEWRDARLIKEDNLNAIRTSHYAPLPALLDAADELGIYMEDEGSFCWCGDSDDLSLTPRILQMESELLARDRNHPSVFMWSVANESDWGFGLLRAHEWIRRSDPTRPTGGSWGGDAVDFQIRHNPISAAELDKAEKSARPVLWDECWCIFQGIWGDAGELWVDPGQRDYYAKPLPALYARMMNDTNIAGTQIWAWSDDIFCAPDRGIEYGRRGVPWNFIDSEYHFAGRGEVGDAPWGVVDGWRRKKPEFWIIKKLHSPIKVAEGALPIPSAGEPITVFVTNQYDFTDLAEIQVHWQLGTESGDAKVAGPPHTTGRLGIVPHETPQSGQTLQLTFTDKRGNEVDAYALPFGAFAAPAPPLARVESDPPLRIMNQPLLEGDLTRVIGGDFELAFAKTRTALRRCTVMGKSVLLDLPRLHVLVSGRPTEPQPEAATWRLESVGITSEDGKAVITEKGRYPQFAGSYRTEISPDGGVTTRASFIYSGPDILAREIGLVFATAPDCQRLQWSRRGDFSVYPAYDPARLVGAATPMAAHEAKLPPSWPWGEDNTSLGCNDFRGVKQNIDWASLSGPPGAGLCVQSDGTQSARAMLGPDRIFLNINDWYGGSHVGLGEWIGNYGEGRPLKSGQTVESTVRFHLGLIGRAGGT